MFIDNLYNWWWILELEQINHHVNKYIQIWRPYNSRYLIMWSIEVIILGIHW
jgi:hypothetical protein